MALFVHSVETFGSHEGPGIRLVVFLQGCHFRCLYCHNPDTWAIGAGQKTEVNQLMNRLHQQQPYLRHGGLTVSGGEPLIQRHELIPLFQQAQAAGFHTALDTNGSILDAETQELLSYTDLVLLDVKHIEADQHLRLTGQLNQPVLTFADYLSSINKPFWLRYVLVPGWTDQPEALQRWAERFHNAPGLERVEILPFHTLGAYKYEALKIANPLAGLRPPTPETVAMAQHIFEEYFPVVIVR